MTKAINPMLERVAEAMAHAPLREGETFRSAMQKMAGVLAVDWDEAQWSAQMLTLARAAVQALVEPDEAMVGIAMAAAVTKMAYAGMEVDALECLLTGDGRGNTPPGILRTGMTEFHRAMLQTILDQHARNMGKI